MNKLEWPLTGYGHMIMEIVMRSKLKPADKQELLDAWFEENPIR